MNFISLECSTSSPSVSIFSNNKHIDIYQIEESTSSVLPLCIQKILEKNSILINKVDYIATIIGPGTFTGIRVGLSFSQGLAYSLGIPIVPINAIDVLNDQVKMDGKYTIAMHSHKNFIIYQHFNDKNKNHMKFGKVEDIKDKTIFGIGLEKFQTELDYNPLKLSSFEVGEYAIRKYTELVEKNISLIKPIYLNEYKVDNII